MTNLLEKINQTFTTKALANLLNIQEERARRLRKGETRPTWEQLVIILQALEGTKPVSDMSEKSKIIPYLTPYDITTPKGKRNWGMRLTLRNGNKKRTFLFPYTTEAQLPFKNYLLEYCMEQARNASNPPSGSTPADLQRYREYERKMKLLQE